MGAEFNITRNWAAAVGTEFILCHRIPSLFLALTNGHFPKRDQKDTIFLYVIVSYLGFGMPSGGSAAPLF